MVCVVILVQLNISVNQLCGLDHRGRGTYTAEGIQAIADALSVAPSITQVLTNRFPLSSVFLPTLHGTN